MTAPFDEALLALRAERQDPVEQYLTRVRAKAWEDRAVYKMEWTWPEEAMWVMEREGNA